jgi:ADP-ribosyl-[dinitrogen reductase] hydrolase
VLLAANLGRDSDTTAAIAGQSAGALYGLSGIPDEWIGKLALSERINETGRNLFALKAAPDHQPTAENST